MSGSILTSVKSMLGIEEEYDVFDTDIIIHINTAISILHQIGLASADGFVITGPTEQWSNLVDNSKNLELVKTLIYLRVRKVFDPPQSQTAMSAIDAQISELEWRLNVEVDNGGNSNG